MTKSENVMEISNRIIVCIEGIDTDVGIVALLTAAVRITRSATLLSNVQAIGGLIGVLEKMRLRETAQVNRVRGKSQ